MIDYTPYVMAVYAIATVVYGGSALFWQYRLKSQLRLLAEAAEHPHDQP